MRRRLTPSVGRWSNMAPEVVNRQGHIHSADWWSFGGTDGMNGIHAEVERTSVIFV